METKQHVTKTSMSQWQNQRRNFNIPWGKWQWKYNHKRPMGCSKSSFKRVVYSYTGPPQEVWEISSYLTLYLRRLRKRKKKNNQIPKLAGGKKKNISGCLKQILKKNRKD